MINLFNESEKEKILEKSSDWDLADLRPELLILKSDSAKYIICRYLELADYIHPEDIEVICLLDSLCFYAKAEGIDEFFRLLETEILLSDGSRELINEMTLDFLITNLTSCYRSYPKNKDILKYLGMVTRLQKKIKKEQVSLNDRSKPLEIKKYLDEYIIGQDKAKKTVATAVYNHMKRMRNPDLEFPTDVVLLIGPSGCGKTEIMRRVRDITNLPMVFTDISSLGVSQTKGRHKEDILVSLLDEAKGDKDKAEQGIVFLDEFDKILVPAISSEGEDVHRRVQGQLLTMLEGSDVEIDYRKKKITFNTSRVLFVLAGAFEGIEEFIKSDIEEREDTNIGIGFTAISRKALDLSIVNKNINHKVLTDYGMRKELAGRIEDIAVLEALKKEDYLKILTSVKDNVIDRYKNEVELISGARLVFSDDALEAVVEKAMGIKTGVRSLNSIIRNVMRDILFEAAEKGNEDIIITKDDIMRG